MSELPLQTAAHLQRKAYNILRDKVNRILAPYNLTPSAWSVLSAIAARSAATPQTISKDVGIDKPNITVALRALEQKRLVEVEPNENDKRSKFYSLTWKASQTLKSVEQEITRDMRAITAPVSQAELDTYFKILTNVITNAEQEGL